jgi:ssDNA-binding Zn-finger/Zn-ribbon topoisomerase 1
VICIEIKNVTCPHCGYKMPIRFSDGAVAKGIFTKCKGKNCKKEFEIKINVK